MPLDLSNALVKIENVELKTTDQSPAVKDNTNIQASKFYTLTNSRGTKLIVSDCGAAVVSLLVKDKEGDFADIVLGYEKAEDYLKDDYYIGTVIGRYANRIAGDTVMIDGERYTIFTKEGGYHLHGGAVGFNKKIFYGSPFRETGKSGIVFKYTSPHLEEGFPGELLLQVIYTLDDYDAWTIEYKAVCNQDTIINLTQHTYFNLTGNPSTNIDGHELKIAADYYLPVNSQQLPTGELAPVKNTPFDFTHFKTISEDIKMANAQLLLSNGYDHSFVLEKQHTPSLKYAAEVREKISGRKMDVYTTEPALHFYSGNFLDNIKGKLGILYNKRAGFCLETQHFPDAPNNPHFPSTLLKAGEEFYSKTVFHFSVE